jgi:hypothetical protein
MSIGRKYNIRLMLDIVKHHKRGKQWTTLEDIKKRQRREDRASVDVRRRIINFYLSPDISREVPNTNEVPKIKESTNAEMVQKHIMFVTVLETYSIYKVKFQNDKIGLILFRKPQVKQVSETNRRSYLCQTCCNAALKAKVLRKFFVQMENERCKDRQRPNIRINLM